MSTSWEVSGRLHVPDDRAPADPYLHHPCGIGAGDRGVVAVISQRAGVALVCPGPVRQLAGASAAPSGALMRRRSSEGCETGRGAARRHRGRPATGVDAGPHRSWSTTSSSAGLCVLTHEPGAAPRPLMNCCWLPMPTVRLACRGLLSRRATRRWGDRATAPGRESDICVARGIGLARRPVTEDLLSTWPALAGCNMAAQLQRGRAGVRWSAPVAMGRCGRADRMRRRHQHRRSDGGAGCC